MSGLKKKKKKNKWSSTEWEPDRGNQLLKGKETQEKKMRGITPSSKKRMRRERENLIRT